MFFFILELHIFFISISHSEYLNYKIESLKGGMMISTPSDKTFVVESVCNSCKVRTKKCHDVSRLKFI